MTSRNPVLRIGGLNQPPLEFNPSGKTATTPQIAVTDARVPVGAHSFNVADPLQFAVGDEVFVQWVSNQAWVDSVGMAQIPDCGDTLIPVDGCLSWDPQDYTIQFRRVITAISGTTLTVDLPLTTAITATNGGAVVWKYDDPNRVTLSGVRDINFVSEYSGGPEDETHAWNAVHFAEIRHGFAVNLLCQQFGYMCVGVLRSATHITTKDSRSENMISRIVGGRRYSFYIEGGSNLFTGCTVESGRHQFISGSKSAGPNVFHNCHATGSNNDIGPHHRWGTGILYDGVTGGMLTVEDRGNSGSGHGWSGAAIVYWNCISSEVNNLYQYSNARLKVEAAPGSLNWAIGNVGAADFGNGRGVWESHGRAVLPASLYTAQKAAAGRVHTAAGADLGSAPEVAAHQESQATPCPQRTTGANVQAGCTCDAGYSGSIVPMAVAPFWTGFCADANLGAGIPLLLYRQTVPKDNRGRDSKRIVRYGQWNQTKCPTWDDTLCAWRSTEDQAWATDVDRITEENLGRNCWNGCNKVYGTCDFCGTGVCGSNKRCQPAEPGEERQNEWVPAEEGAEPLWSQQEGAPNYSILDRLESDADTLRMSDGKYMDYLPTRWPESPRIVVKCDT